ncbi:MAG: endonuclease III [Sphingomonas sp.]|uniref:endonuclease III domain-containing protein n=1 Tax=Sphingomonas sp. TaxID=28214 RepID=UPI0025E0C22D|nr:endonuclease III [Sphingomonas sp.]MBX3565492.1 endonuclease III [Sphingomonas sp.]
MQSSFGFNGHDDIARWQAALAPLLRHAELLPPRRPLGQLIKSMISGRTRDAVSQAAYDGLVARFGSPRRIARSSPDQLLAVIGNVTFAEDKAANVVAALRRIERETPGYKLDFLGEWALTDALAWLERLPGVGRKVAASTLNASTLSRPVFIVDSHVLRILQRLGFVATNAEARVASEAVTAAMSEWSGSDFLNYHVVMKLLGQHVCRSQEPDCRRCPLARDCKSRVRGRAD